MRSKIAIGLAILGLLLLAAGIGQRTFWLPPSTVTASVAAPAKGSPLTVLDPAVLNSHNGQVHLSIKAPGTIDLAIGRPGDVNAWVGTAAHLSVTGANADFTQLTTTHTDGEATVPTPVGADLWVSERNATGTMDFDWTPPADGDWSILLSAGGTNAAPTDISVTAPNDDSTPWAVPLMVVGAIALALAALAFLFKRKKRNRADRPRRSAASAVETISAANGSSAPAAGSAKDEPAAPAPLLPSDPSSVWTPDATQSIPVSSADAPAEAAEPQDAPAGPSKDDDTSDDDSSGTGTPDGTGVKGAQKPLGKSEGTSDGDAGSKKDTGKTKRTSAASLRARWGAAVAAVLVAGSIAPAHADTATPSPSGTSTSTGSATATSTGSATASAPAKAPGFPALVESQFNRIVTDVATVVGTGDNGKDAKALETRVAGSALEIRAANYKIRSQVASYPAVLPVASSKLLTKVVTTSTTWPRTIMAVTQGAGNEVPQVLTLVQAGPRDNYKLTESTPLLPGETFPKSSKAGSEQLAPDSKASLLFSPAEALAALSDRLTKSDSSWKDKFADSVYVSDTETYEAQFKEKAKDATYSFAHSLLADSTRVLRTEDGGAMVLANFKFQVDATANTDAKLTIADEAAVFAGGKETTTGYTLAFGEPVVLYIPPAGSTAKLTLISASRDLVGAAFK